MLQRGWILSSIIGDQGCCIPQQQKLLGVPCGKSDGAVSCLDTAAGTASCGKLAPHLRVQSFTFIHNYPMWRLLNIPGRQGMTRLYFHDRHWVDVRDGFQRLGKQSYILISTIVPAMPSFIPDGWAFSCYEHVCGRRGA